MEASVGEMGDVRGVEEAIVPPKPVRDVGEETLSGAHLPVMEHVVGVITAVGAMSAGLCGEPIAMTKGMLLPDPVLNFRCGEEGCMFAVLDFSDPARVGRESDGGVAVFEPVRMRWVDRPGIPDAGELEVLRE